MSKKTESACGCDCSCKSGSTGRAIFAGALGGIIVVAILVGLAAFVLRRLGSHAMPRLMERMMRDCECSDDIKGCGDRCCCDGSSDADEAAPTLG